MQDRKEILQITNPRANIYLSKGQICMYGDHLCKVRIVHLWERSSLDIYAEVEILEAYSRDFDLIIEGQQTMIVSILMLTPYLVEEDNND